MPTAPGMHGDSNLSYTSSHNGDAKYKIKDSEFNYYIGGYGGPIDPALLHPFPRPTSAMSPYTIGPNSTGPNIHNATGASVHGFGDANTAGSMQLFPGHPPTSVGATPQPGNKRGRDAATHGNDPRSSHRIKRNDGSYSNVEGDDGLHDENGFEGFDEDGEDENGNDAAANDLQ